LFNVRAMDLKLKVMYSISVVLFKVYHKNIFFHFYKVDGLNTIITTTSLKLLKIEYK